MAWHLTADQLRKLTADEWDALMTIVRSDCLERDPVPYQESATSTQDQTIRWRVPEEDDFT